PESRAKINDRDLKNHLKRYLPEYMVPGAYVVISQLPLTPNGKVDRRALPKPDLKAEDSSYVAHSNAIEEILAEIWAEILQRNHVSIHDNFFDLGGQSLLAMQLISRVRHVLSIELPLHALFEC